MVTDERKANSQNRLIALNAAVNSFGTSGAKTVQELTDRADGILDYVFIDAPKVEKPNLGIIRGSY